MSHAYDLRRADEGGSAQAAEASRQAALAGAPDPMIRAGFADVAGGGGGGKESGMTTRDFCNLQKRHEKMFPVA